MEERYENAAVTWTQQFCRINSFLGAGKREAVFLAEKILKESCDATVTVYDADTEEPYIIAEKICENPKFRLLLEGHLDVVSPEGMEHPFDAEIKDGILYGRGSVDMKGGCGSMLAAFVAACQKPLEGDLYLMFSTDEEYAGEEIKKALEKGHLPKVDFALIAEPTNGTMATAHKGEAWIDVEFFGKSAHSSMPHMGKNAIYMATAFLHNLQAYLPEMKKMVHPLYGAPTMSVGTIEGGSTPNVVPPYAKITIDIRYLPGTSSESFLKVLQNLAVLCKTENEDFFAKITKIGEWNDVCTDRESPTFRRIWQAASKAMGKEVELTVMTGWGEGGFMNLYGIPVVYFGPGENGMSHRPEEQIHVDEIKKVALAYEQIINEVCGMKRNTLEEVLKQTGIMVADGAMATELERMGCDLNDSLWSAKVLAEQPELIGKVHRSYFEAGADCGITASYQATIDGFCKRGFTEAEAEELIRRSVDIMVKERADWWQAEGKDSGRAYPLVCASVGPYGAYLADGSEYRGNYGVSKEELRNFHKRRMELLWDAGTDLFAVETIPCLEEAIVAAELTQEMDAACWISFSCKNEAEISDGTKIAHCAKALEAYDCVKAIGINCTAPHFVASLIKEIKNNSTKPIIVYPNSGEEYDPVTKTWHGNKDGKCYCDFAAEWIAAGAKIVGGCCRTTPENIREVAELARRK